MGILEEQEWLQDLITEEFSEVSGLYGGIEEDTVVYYKNAAKLWGRLCLRLQIRANFVPGLTIIEDYVHQFDSILKKREKEREKFVEELTGFIYEKTGRLHDPREVLFNGQLPHSDDPVQFCREQMAYELKLGNMKNQIRNKYGFYKESFDFYKARTIEELTFALFGRKYLFG